VYHAYRDDVVRLLRSGFSVKGSTGKGSAPMRVPGLTDWALQDAVQEVFVKAFGDKARRSYDGVRPYRPFLLQIAKNVRIDQMRRSWREVGLAEAGLPERAPDTPDDWYTGHPYFRAPEETLHWQRMCRAAAHFLRGLDHESQRFALLRFVDELSQTEIARAMSVTRRRARTLEGRLVTGLKRHLQQECLA
jgi:RNA polymerase sigma factor (sigma-70 family)